MAYVPSVSVSFAFASAEDINTDVNVLTSTTAGNAKVDYKKYTDKMIEWLRAAEGGYFSPKLEMRRLHPNDPESIFGMYTNEPIKADETIIELPQSVILNGKETKEEAEGLPSGEAMECPTMRNLHRELQLGNESKYAPYVNYLLATQPPGMLPSAWSKEGKELLTRVLSNGDGVQTLPPSYPISWVEDYVDDCDGTLDPLAVYAALIVVQRSWDDLLLPVFDMMSHRNGRWLNTDNSDVHAAAAAGEPIRVFASRDIEAGEEIYTSYNLCRDCEGRYFNYGSPEILRDYGFVENFPQTWIFHDIGIGFRLDAKPDAAGGDDDGNGNDDAKLYEIVEWVGEEPDDDDIELLKEHLEQVIETEEDLLDRDSNSNSKVPEHEFEIISDYISAMGFAMKVAIDHYEGISQENCLQDGTCTYSLDRYANLNEELIIYTDDDYSGYTCDIDREFAVFDNGVFVELEGIKSQYQQISFSWNPKNRDTCMDLDNIVQICDSYRPHYHEMVVHNTARFLPKIERVLFVGGGDSMLLHEILKYPSLELVVGLELDQRVTRGAFKHFGTQPHYHNEKVQWWYGDASKSLLMLPKEYFASFDMVLVDLSETVMSFQVTSELDVLDALTLLMKPGGIFVKNEVYFGRFREMFPHSVQIHWYDNPVICSQVLVLGSRTVDFMRPKLTDHGVEGLFIKPLDEIADPYHLYHDYARNTTSRQLCDVMVNKGTDVTEQTRSPGIMMIVEAENISVDLSDTKAFMWKLSNALENIGLSIISSKVKHSATGSITTMILAEGYVVARCVSEMKYCGFDIHFWGKFDKHEDTMKALVLAIGGSTSSVSSFRVIAGGMFGAPSWKSDKGIHGPQFEEICGQFKESTSNHENTATEKVGINQDVVDSVFGKMLSMSTEKNLNVAMLVGNNGDSQTSESSRSAIEKLEVVKEVVALSCPTMVEFNEFASDASDKLTSCEKELFDSLMKFAENEKFNALILDSSADKLTASILLKIFSAYKGMLTKVLHSDALVLAAVNDKENAWRKNFVKAFKHGVFKDEPAFYNEILITTNDDVSSFTLLVSNEGGERLSENRFLGTLNSTLADFEKEHGLKTGVQIVNGGEWFYQEDFVPSQYFLPDDFNQVPSLDQWKSQKPLGHQIIVQLELTEGKGEISTALIRQTLAAAVSHSSLSRNYEMTGIEEFNDLGEGSILTTSWAEGSIIILWDGRKHVDINLFTVNGYEKESKSFEQKFLAGMPFLQTVLRDEQPRGAKRVVSFMKDLHDYAQPHWA